MEIWETKHEHGNENKWENRKWGHEKKTNKEIKKSKTGVGRNELMGT